MSGAITRHFVGRARSSVFGRDRLDGVYTVLQLFISYNREAHEVASGVASDLDAMGHNVWLDEELSGGQRWWDQILERIRSADLFVFILEQAALDSAACQREYEYASALGKPILPVLVSDDVSVAVLPPALTAIQYVDYRNPDRNAALQLARAISSTAPADLLPDPLPEPPPAPLSYLGDLAQKVGSAAPLTYEDQSALLIDLKRGLRSEATRADALRLLVKMRDRRDLLASIAFEIDDAVGVARKLERDATARSPDSPTPSAVPNEEVRPKPTAAQEASSDTSPATALASRHQETLGTVIARLRGKNPPGIPSRFVAAALQLLAGAGFLYARHDARRRWLYPIGFVMMWTYLIFQSWDLEYDLLQIDVFTEDGARLFAAIGLFVYLAGLLDATVNLVIRPSLRQA